MALNTSLVIAGDGASAEAALSNLDKGLASAAQEAKRLSAAFADADKSINRLASAQATAATETARAKAEYAAGSITIQQYKARLLETKTALSLVEGGHRDAVSALKQAQTAIGGASVSLGQARAGYINLGRQVQDVAVQMQGGANIGTIVAQQGGQIADAVAQMGGRFAGLASFLSGPWGAAIIVGAGVLLNYLVPALMGTGDAADSTKKDVIDLSGSLSSLETNANAAKAAMEKLRDAMNVASVETNAADAEVKNKITAMGRVAAVNREIDQLKSLLNNPTFVAASGEGVNGLYTQLARLESKKKEAESQIKLADDALASIRSDAVVTDIRKRNQDRLDALAKKDKPKREKKDNSAALAERTREFGEDTASRIANLKDQFSELPTAVTRASKATRELDDILSDIEHRKGLSPDAVAKFRQQIDQAKGSIQDSLIRPFNDYLDKAREAAEVDRLLAAGRDDEAAALRVVIGLKNQQKPLDESQLETVLATVEAESRRALVLRDQRALIQSNVRAVQDMRSALEQTVANAFRGKFSLDAVLSSLGNSFVQIQSQRIVESLFGNTLRSLERQATGADKVEVSGSRMATAMDDASTSVTRLTASLSSAADPLNLLGTRDLSSVTANLTVRDLQAVAARNGALFGNSAANDNGAPETTGNEIVVTGRKSRWSVLAGEGTGLLADMITRLSGDLGFKIPDVIGAAMKVSLAKLEKSLPSALSGAFVGASASRIVLGDRGTGGTIGSALGGVLGQKFGEKVLAGGLTKIASGLGSFAGPIGSALGGVLGGLLGGVFKSTTKGYAVISNSGVSSGGNNSELVQQAASSGSGIQSTINQIAQQLGASVGSYSVSIGKRSSGWISVSASGSSQVADKSWKKANSGGDLIYDGKDEAAAIAVAISNAIADGAIAGVSAKVKAALLSSTDIDQAVREAVKVQDLELALGGISAALEKEFRTFQQTAAERVALAKKYGFDLVKVEELNNKERLALSQKLLKDQVGSLQDLIDQMTSGSLFEGSAVDQRNALLAKISAAQADANAGVEGAADKLANLYQQLNSVSKDAFGTTGGFAADRQAIIDGAQQAIAAANARVVAADKATDPALATTNSLLDEIAGQSSKSLAGTDQQTELLKAMLEGINRLNGVAGTNYLKSQLAY